MFYISRLVGRCLIGLLSFGILVFPIQGHAAAQANLSSVTPGNSRWALVVHPGPDGTEEAKNLTNVLKDSYGFRPENTFEIYDSSVILDNIYDAMDQIFNEIRSNDVLFVHFSMPIERGFERTALLPWDYEPDSPWRSLDIVELMEWLIQMPDVSVLVTFPSCPQESQNSYAQYLLDTIRKTDRRNTVDFMAVCDMESIGIRWRQEEKQLVPSAQRRGVLSDGIARILGDVARSSDFDWITSDDLMRALNNTLESYFVSVTHSSTYQPSTFAFVPAPSEISGYKTDYRQAQSPEAKQRVLYTLANVASEGGELESSTVRFLSEIAIDPAASLGDPDVNLRVALLLRWLSVDLLG